MMKSPQYPSLYQVNIRVWLQKLTRQLNRPATLDDIPDNALDEWVSLGFDWIYVLGVWQTGIAAPKVSRTNPEWVAAYQRLLADLTDEDVCGSCFAVTGYTVHQLMGGNAALERLRDRLHQRGLKLMLDFVPNHTAPDHPWVQLHPDYYVPGTPEQHAQEPQNYCLVSLPSGDRVFAYGRDPYFAGWCDTLQLNYGNPALHTAQANELLNIAQLCDGVRCDMAMLILPEIFQRTWGIPVEPFWQQAIDKVRFQHPGFVFMAEVYWDMEWTLQQLGFDYTYDKRLYDRLVEQHARPVREHFWADLNYQSKSARFLENHDEPRAAGTFPPDVHQAAAILTFLCPGLRFFHQGQLEGFKHHISIHLQRGPNEPTDEAIQAFYRELLACLQNPVVRDGFWQLADCYPAWDDNWSSDHFISFCWRGKDGKRLLVIVNYADDDSQCYLKIPGAGDLAGKEYQLKDLMGAAVYDRPGDLFLSRGVYFDLPAWGYHVFEMNLID
ncbi:MAG: alpha-amylase family glycosyl hydrolase [Leptolyngbyaceae cyanobacterium bins.302]|nr:alpha-amylase family glycosyl hydrolase [Leptolyngbyaceae cyanobacterium bins.302]